MQWFRMYAEFATDPVVQCLAFDDQRHFVMILCLKCSGVLDKQFGHPQVRIDMLKRALGLDGKAFDEAKTRLGERGLIDGEWNPRNWDKRQFISDRDPTAAERQRRHRERVSHGPVTRESHRSESDTETYTETEKTKNKGADAPLVLPDSLPKEVWQEWLAYRKERRLPVSHRALGLHLKALAKFDTATQREMIETAMQANWKGIFPLRAGAAPKKTWTPPKTLEEIEAMEAARARTGS